MLVIHGSLCGFLFFLYEMIINAGLRCFKIWFTVCIRFVILCQWVQGRVCVRCISVSVYVRVPGIMWHLQNWNSSHTTLHKRLSVFLRFCRNWTLFVFHWSRWPPNKYTPSFWLQLTKFQTIEKHTLTVPKYLHVATPASSSLHVRQQVRVFRWRKQSRDRPIKSLSSPTGYCLVSTVQRMQSRLSMCMSVWARMCMHACDLVCVFVSHKPEASTIKASLRWNSRV